LIDLGNDGPDLRGEFGGRGPRSGPSPLGRTGPNPIEALTSSYYPKGYLD